MNVLQIFSIKSNSFSVKLDREICISHDRPGYIVHHREPLTQETITDTEISLNHRNLEYVCKDCHDRFEGHGIGGGSSLTCRFDEDGQPISMREVDRYGRKH